MPAPALNGYALTNHFRKLRLRWDFTHLEAYLFFELVALCNDEGWPAEFSVRNGVLTGALTCSEKGLIKARKTLAKAGLLTYTEGQNRRPTAYRFVQLKGLPEVSVAAAVLPLASANIGSTPPADALPEGLPEVSVSSGKGLPEDLPQVRDAAGKHLPEGLPEVSVAAKHLPKGLPKGLPEVSPYKEQTKTKRTLTQSQGDCVGGGPSSFDAFWSAYDKKRDRFKCEKKWDALTAAEQAAALAHAPTYAAATPERQYRKDPLTYLNGKCWLDEDLPASRGSQRPAPLVPAAPSPAEAAPAPNEEFLAQQAARASARRQAHFEKYATAP